MAASLRTHVFRGELGQSSLFMVMGVMAFVALLVAGMFQMNSLTKTQGETVVASSEFYLLLSEINSILLENASCQNAISSATSVHPTQTLNSLSSPTPITIYQGNTTTPLFAANTMFGRLTITNLALTHVQAAPAAVNPYNDVYYANLEVDVQKPNGLLGSQTLSSSMINMNIRVDPSTCTGAGGTLPCKIIGCTSLSFLGTTVQHLPVCPPGKAIFSNGLGLSCVTRICPTGTPTGYQPGGDAICP